MKKNNIKNRLGLKITANAVAFSTIISTFTGCSKIVDCDISGKHAHLYINEDGITRYIDKEYEEYKGFNRQEEYITIDKSDEELYKFYDNKDLINFNDNYEKLLKLQEQNKDFIEYEYMYTSTTIINAGKSIIPIKKAYYSWTTNPYELGLTGKIKINHYMYQACNIYKDEYGKYVIVTSEWVDDISVLKDKYEYITLNYYKIESLVNDKEYSYEIIPKDGQNTDIPKVKIKIRTF